MDRSTAAATVRAICFVAGAMLWTAMTGPVAFAAQSGPAAPSAATVSATRRQTPPSDNTAVDGDGWSYGARGIVTILRQESLGTGFGISGFAILPLGASLDLEGEVGFVAMNTRANGLPAGRLSMIPLRATLRVQVWRFAGADLYAGGGAGVYLSHFAIDEAVQRELAELGFGATASVDPAFALHAVVGLEWQRGRLRFGVDAKYVVGQADAPSEIVDLVSDQRFSDASALDLNGFWIAGGVRLGF